MSTVSDTPSLFMDSKLVDRWDRYRRHMKISPSETKDGERDGRIAVEVYRSSLSGGNGVCEPRRTYPTMSEAMKAEAPTADEGMFTGAFQGKGALFLGLDSKYYLGPSWARTASGTDRQNLTSSHGHTVPIAAFSIDPSDRCETARLFPSNHEFREKFQLSTNAACACTKPDGPRLVKYPDGTMFAVHPLSHKDDTPISVDDDGGLIYSHDLVAGIVTRGLAAAAGAITPSSTPPSLDDAMSSFE